MNELILFVGVLLNTCTITSYQSVKGQTDSSPNFTSTGDRTHKGGVAVSRDFLKRWGGPLDYGDYIYIDGIGIFQINDCMGAQEHYKVHTNLGTKVRFKTIRQHFDIWVPSLKEEKKIGVQRRKVYFLSRRIN